MAKSKAPLLINSCEFDDQFDQNAQAVVDKMMGDGKFAPGYERTYWDGCTHGFAVRGDLVSCFVPTCCVQLVIRDADCIFFVEQPQNQGGQRRCLRSCYQIP